VAWASSGCVAISRRAVLHHADAVIAAREVPQMASVVSVDASSR
jgi:hypothetical protein